MKLSLDVDLLPKTHAAGGEADIVYEYEETKFYPAHSLLLEATLADKTNQKRMEMEHRFTSSWQSYYDTADENNFIDGMKIISLEIEDLKKIIENKIGYDKLYKIFETAFNSELAPREWRNICIVQKLLNF